MIRKITNKTTGETIELARDLAHPQWVHDQLGTASEAELQRALDNYQPWARDLGPDVDGVEIYEEEAA